MKLKLNHFINNQPLPGTTIFLPSKLPEADKEQKMIVKSSCDQQEFRTEIIFTDLKNGTFKKGVIDLFLAIAQADLLNKIIEERIDVATEYWMMLMEQTFYPKHTTPFQKQFLKPVLNAQSDFFEEHEFVISETSKNKLKDVQKQAQLLIEKQLKAAPADFESEIDNYWTTTFKTITMAQLSGFFFESNFPYFQEDNQIATFHDQFVAPILKEIFINDIYPHLPPIPQFTQLEIVLRDAREKDLITKAKTRP